MWAAKSSAGRSAPACFRAKHRVAKALREAVDRLAGAIQVEAQASFVQCALCRAACAVQLLTQLVEQCHGATSSEGFDC